MKKQTYFLVTGLIFAIIAIAHLIRALTGAAFVVVGWSVPIWLSWVGVVVAAFLSYSAFRLRSRKN